MTKKNIGIKAIETLQILYPEAICSLVYNDPFQLLCATMLSAQCTDERVNKTTPALFAKYPDAKSMSKAKKEDVEKLIYSCGFYKNKANNLVEMAKKFYRTLEAKFLQQLKNLLLYRGLEEKPQI